MQEELEYDPARCPVLAWRTVLRASYAMSGTDLAYAALPAYAPGARYPAAVNASGLSRKMFRVATPISLRACYAMSGTELAYAATLVLCDVRLWCYLPTRVLCDVRFCGRLCCHVISGTDIGYTTMQ
eukprot:705700-Rhodomonas_salina.3